jgi:hypothetical protein
MKNTMKGERREKERGRGRKGERGRKRGKVKAAVSDLR